MMLQVIIEDQLYELNVPEAFLDQAEEFFQRMDEDMDQGFQMSQEWVGAPDLGQRCRMVADKLMDAIEKQNDVLGRMMAGYILRRMPGVETINIDTTGEIQNTTFTLKEGQEPATAPVTPAEVDPNREQAEQEVSQVFKVGRNWRFAVLDKASGQWEEAPLAGSEEEAKRLREQAIARRQRELAADG